MFWLRNKKNIFLLRTLNYIYKILNKETLELGDVYGVQATNKQLAEEVTQQKIEIRHLKAVRK